MSETPEGYGTQSTPDMGESYPPQTGDLLFKEISVIKQRLALLESKLESKFEDMDANENDLCAKMNEYNIKLQKLRKRIKAQSARIQCLEARIERLEAALKLDEHFTKAAEAARPHVGSSARPEPHFCAKCEHTKTWHDATHCYADTVIGRCECDGFEDPCDAFHETRDDQSRVTELEAPAVTTPTVTRERTHGRYGTRNLTKSKPDHIVDANKKVCATCGHAKIAHERYLRCIGGPLGSPCSCKEYKPVATEG